MRRYKCHKCENEHSTDNMASYCASCFGYLKDQLHKTENLVDLLSKQIRKAEDNYANHDRACLQHWDSLNSAERKILELNTALTASQAEVKAAREDAEEYRAMSEIGCGPTFAFAEPMGYENPCWVWMDKDHGGDGLIYAAKTFKEACRMFEAKEGGVDHP